MLLHSCSAPMILTAVSSSDGRQHMRHGKFCRCMQLRKVQMLRGGCGTMWSAMHCRRRCRCETRLTYYCGFFSSSCNAPASTQPYNFILCMWQRLMLDLCHRRAEAESVLQVAMGSWFEPLEHLRGSLAGVLCNPPYIPSMDVPHLQVIFSVICGLLVPHSNEERCVGSS